MMDSSAASPAGAASESKGKCPYNHGSRSAAAPHPPLPSDHPTVTPGAMAKTEDVSTGRCPVLHGPAKPETTASSGRCPVLHGKAAERAAAPADGSGDVDVHDAAAVVQAPDAIKAHFAASYNQVSVRGTTKPSQARVALARRSQAKIGYTEEELDLAGDDVALMQGVGNPHAFAAYREGDTVLDLGCGMGVDTRIAAARVGESGRAVGIDLSEGEVMVAMSKARALRARNLDYRVADMEDLPLPDASVDVVISNGGFCLVPNKDKAFREIFRVLRPGGRIAIACTVRRKVLAEGVRWPVCMNTFMLQSDIEPLLTSIGYEGVSVDTSNSRMDAQTVGEDDIEAAAKAAGVCTHAIRAQLRRQKQSHGAAVAGAGAGASAGASAGDDAAVVEDAGARVTVHKGESQFSHLRNYDMSDLCARVVIVARKAGGTEAAGSTVLPAIEAVRQVPRAVWIGAAVVAVAAITAAVVRSRRA